jgi:hypothetical protein
MEAVGVARTVRKSFRGTRGRRRRRAKKRSSVSSVSSLISCTIKEETQADLDDLENIGMDTSTPFVEQHHVMKADKVEPQDLNVSMITDSSPITLVNTSFNEESTIERSGQSFNSELVSIRQSRSFPNLTRLSYGTEFRGRILDDNLEAMTGINSRPHRVEIFQSASNSISSKTSKDDTASASTPKSSKSYPPSTGSRKPGHMLLTRPVTERVLVITPQRMRQLVKSQPTSPFKITTRQERSNRGIKIRVSGLKKKRATPLFVAEREVRLGVHESGQVESDEEEGEDYSSQQIDTLDSHENSSLSSGSASTSKLRIQRMRTRQVSKENDVLSVKKRQKTISTIAQSSAEMQVGANQVREPSSHSSDIPSLTSSLNYSADTTNFTMDLTASAFLGTARSSLTSTMVSHLDRDTTQNIISSHSRIDDRTCVSPALTDLTTSTLHGVHAIVDERRYESTRARMSEESMPEEELSSSSSSASFPNASLLYISPDRSYDEEIPDWDHSFV